MYETSPCPCSETAKLRLKIQYFTTETDATTGPDQVSLPIGTPSGWEVIAEGWPSGAGHEAHCGFNEVDDGRSCGVGGGPAGICSST
jgi:hypothetical protein